MIGNKEQALILGTTDPFLRPSRRTEINACYAPINGEGVVTGSFHKSRQSTEDKWFPNKSSYFDQAGRKKVHECPQNTGKKK